MSLSGWSDGYIAFMIQHFMSSHFIALCWVSATVVGQETITEKLAACGIRGDEVPCHLGHLLHLHHRLGYCDSLGLLASACIRKELF